ncbi:MAG: ATP-binding protein [Spirochaetaceae bacterium]|nr:ATP-binding protein [Spirochaetaceae bacterium]
MAFQRAQFATLRDRLRETPARIIALFGPRQTGKTTLVRAALRPTDHYLPVDEPDPAGLGVSTSITATVASDVEQKRDSRWLVRKWEAARLEAERRPEGCTLAIDEAHKIPGWSDTVKGLWDADRARGCPLHVVILGSAPLLMQVGLSESLTGRFEPIRVAHWSFGEMAAAFGFDLPAYLYFGGYPGAATLAHDESRWRNYVLGGVVEPTVERDLLALARVDKPVLLRRLVELAAAHSGQILSYTKMLGQLWDAGNTTTLARYLDLLGSAGLIAGFQKYAGSAVRRRASSPKLNVLNTALMTADSGYSFPEAQADRTFWGRIVESAVGAHLCNTAAPDIRVRYWRDGPHEVDFVLQRGRKLVAIEVKSGPRRRGASRALDAFETKFGRSAPLRCLLVGEGGVPLNEFLSAPASAWFEER